MSAHTTIVDALDALNDPLRGMTFWKNGRFVSFRELRSLSIDFGRRLGTIGLAKGQRVVIVHPAEDEFIQIYLGSLWAGVVPVPLYPPFIFEQLDAYRGALTRIVRQVDATFIISSHEIQQLLGPIDSQVPFVTIEEIMASPPTSALPTILPTDIAFLQYTSGSTAEPRGVVVTHEALLSNAQSISSHLEITQEDRGVTWLPLYHDMGLIGFVITPIVAGCGVWFIPPLDFAQRPMLWCELISEVRGTISFAPNFAYSLLARRARDEQLADLDLACWRVAGCGAEPVQINSLLGFAHRLAATGFEAKSLLPSYGLAEMTLAVAISPLGNAPKVLSVLLQPLQEENSVVIAGSGDDQSVPVVSCGPPLPGYEIQITHRDTGSNLGEDREGEIIVRGPSQTSGYFLNRDDTESTYRNGWVHTGDLGFLHEKQLYITGRLKDVIVLKGRNIHPQDIEFSACEEPGVRRGNAVAFGVAMSEKEEAVVVLEAAGDAEPAELVGRVRHRVRNDTGVALGDVVVVGKETLPRTTSGKVRRGLTRTRYLRDELMKLSQYQETTVDLHSRKNLSE